MQYMMMLKTRENLGAPPAEFWAAMGRYLAEVTAEGNVVSMGGLLPSSAGAEIRVQDGKVVTTHGPFAETTELIGGYAIVNADSLEHAIEQGARFVQVHLDHWPGFEGSSEIRQIAEQ
jgi:hypothetical protein